MTKKDDQKKISRRGFLTGMAAGAGAAAAAWAGGAILRGEHRRFYSPLTALKKPAEHQPEMKVILLGTGTPKSTPDRSKPANVILAGEKAFLVDCGGGVVERLLAAGVLPERITDVFFTHHHSDHNSGFADFFVSGWTGAGRFPRETPLTVYGPSNTRAIIGNVMDSLSWDIELRIRQAKNDPQGGQVNYREKEEGVVYDQDGLTVTAFAVDHGIAKPSLGYTFTYKNKTIVISGDTRPCEHMVTQARNADVLIHEAYSKAWTDVALKRMPGANPEQTKAAIESVMAYHSSTIDVARIAQQAQAKHLVFTHLLPSPAPLWYFEALWARGVSDVYTGRVTVGRDLMMF